MTARMAGPSDRYRQPTSARSVAEAAFKSATRKEPEIVKPQRPALPGAKELVSLRVDQDVLAFFQADGPGWQDRMLLALRKAAGK